MEEDTIRLPAHLRECQHGGFLHSWIEEGVGWGEEVFLFLWKRAGKPLALDFFFFVKVLAGLIFLNILFNQRKLLLNTVQYIPTPCTPCQGFGLFLMTGTNVEVLF